MGTCQSLPSTNTSSTKAIKIKPTDHPLDVTQRTLPGLVGNGSSSHFKHNPEVDRATSHPIFKAIEEIQIESGVPFGRLLDAGTGLGSLQWIAHLTSTASKEDRDKFGVSDWNAITASETMIRLCTAEGKRLGIATENNLVLGNWFGEERESDGDEDEANAAPELITFPHGDVFDTILVDYVIGAMDAFSPFRQDCIFDRLAKHLSPGGHLYLLGMEPIPEKQSGVADLVCKVKRLRDSCILLAGERCYREHPISWVERNMKRSSLHVTHTLKFPLLQREQDLMDQIGTARWMLRRIDDVNLAGALEESLDNLQREIHTSMHGETIKLGFDYLVVAEKPREEEREES